MKRRMIYSLLAAWMLVLSSPVASFSCLRPCRMTQKQMRDCAASCAALKRDGQASLSSGSCTQLHISAQAQYLGAAAFKLDTTAQLSLIDTASTQRSVPLLARACSLRAPPDSLSPVLNKSASPNAPPVLI